MARWNAGMKPNPSAAATSPRPPRSPRERALWLALAIVMALVAVLGVPVSFYRVALLLAALFLLLRLVVPWRWLKALTGALAIVLLLFTGGLMALFGVPHIAVSAPSPDGEVTAELVETARLLDRHFLVRLTTYWLGVVPVSREVYDSPDEGPRGGERFLWSRDGRHVLLVGTQLFAIDEACLASGEALYLLVDRLTGTLRSNATQTRGPRFRLEDLARMDFAALPAPGSPTWHDSKRRCVPPAWP